MHNADGGIVELLGREGRDVEVQGCDRRCCRWQWCASTQPDEKERNFAIGVQIEQGIDRRVSKAERQTCRQGTCIGGSQQVGEYASRRPKNCGGRHGRDTSRRCARRCHSQ